MILEFNRTLFDTSRGKLFADALRFLETAKAVGFELVLVTRRLGFSRLSFENSGLREIISEVRVVEGKTLELFAELARRCDQPEQSFVIGDRMREEIRFGNLQGLSTVLVRRGWFMKETPAGAVEVPDYAVESLEEIVSFLSN